ncbi:hypothetical protein FKW77_005187 [Venturia effusa]|uniref:Uncharacterized protein n=1 Tax=Venturia effusa TaxID=50376 RepID=A0A517LMU0_9PEZI|nr:hypothetical protein FKW77_005187 [Venturia effusa]
MKFAIGATYFSLAAVQASAIPTSEAQGAIQVGVPKMIKTKYNDSAKRAIIRYPAFTLQPNGQGSGAFHMDPRGQSGILSIGDGMCSSCTLLSAHFRLVFPDGKEADPKDGVYIHHMTSTLSPKKADNPIGGMSLGGAGGISAYFIDRGEDSGQTDTIFTSTTDKTVVSGYQVHGKPSIRVSYDLVNYKSEAKQLHLELEYEYLDGIKGSDAGHTLKSVMGSPKLNGKTVSQPMKVSKDTKIVWARGHLHQGGVEMSLSVNGAQKCVSKPTYNAAGVITAMSLCPEVIDIKAGQTLTIASVYDTKEHKLYVTQLNDTPTREFERMRSPELTVIRNRRESSDGSGKAAKGTIGGSDVMVQKMG